MAISYPMVQGVRVDPSSVEMRLGSPVNLIVLFVSVSWKRSRSRTKLVLNHPDPVGKTRGKNEYEASLELAIAEYNAIVNVLGAGYGDKSFQITLNIKETGFDPVVVQIQNCTLDEDDGDASGSNALTRKIALNPTKILVNGLDDLAVPLAGSVVQQ
jgi:hypothetical protein